MEKGGGARGGFFYAENMNSYMCFGLLRLNESCWDAREGRRQASVQAGFRFREEGGGYDDAQPVGRGCIAFLVFLHLSVDSFSIDSALTCGGLQIRRKRQGAGPGGGRD